jgi:hypothetical protein
VALGYVTGPDETIGKGRQWLGLVVAIEERWKRLDGANMAFPVIPMPRMRQCHGFPSVYHNKVLPVRQTGHP